jgi:uncharacterized metal-binding protein YceD (DUF177 family)
MKELAPAPLSRLIRVDPLPRDGIDVAVVANADELARIAAFNDLVELKDLSATLHLEPRAKGRVAVTGRLNASLTQSCVVTLEPLAATMDAPVEAIFAPGPRSAENATGPDEDPPEPIVNGMADVGAVVSEFLTLNLDPYPRKEGAAFTAVEDDVEASPFKALAERSTKK